MPISSSTTSEPQKPDALLNARLDDRVPDGWVGVEFIAYDDEAQVAILRMILQFGADDCERLNQPGDVFVVASASPGAAAWGRGLGERADDAGSRATTAALLVQAQAKPRREGPAGAAVSLQWVRATAEQLTRAQRWRLILSWIFRQFLHGRVAGTTSYVTDAL